jgi:phosphatidylglycerol:prolipoprotein diacylglycerol transferase
VGNFINGELWGRVADPALPWAMVFPGAVLADGSNPPRHPSQIYQFLLEGVLLFVLLWLYARQPRKTGQVSGAFLLGYGLCFGSWPNTFASPMRIWACWRWA